MSISCNEIYYIINDQIKTRLKHANIRYEEMHFALLGKNKRIEKKLLQIDELINICEIFFNMYCRVIFFSIHDKMSLSVRPIYMYI